MGKRMFDLVVGGAALVLLSPLLALVAVAVKLDSKGPALFRQVRVGRHGRVFRIRKFRTMRMGAEASGPMVTVAGDPRVTRLGRFLRRWKLDELPQLIDVVAGSMSLVGPRPEVPGYVEHWPAELRGEILSVRPGLTDPAALAFLCEEERLSAADDPHQFYLDEILPAKTRMYAEYARSVGVAGDLRIILQTIRAVTSRRRSTPDKL